MACKCLIVVLYAWFLLIGRFMKSGNVYPLLKELVEDYDKCAAQPTKACSRRLRVKLGELKNEITAERRRLKALDEERG